MEGVQTRKMITQPIEDREAMAGLNCIPSYAMPFTPAAASNTGIAITAASGEEDISIRKIVQSEQLYFGNEAVGNNTASIISDASTSSMLSDDGTNFGVDLRKLQLQHNLKVRQPQATVDDLSINVRAVKDKCHVSDETLDLGIAVEPELFPKKPKGYITHGTDQDVLNLMKEKPAMKGVICNNKVLHTEHGLYLEGEHYSIIPDTQSKGAYGEAAMCQDLKTGKPFVCKKVHGKLCENEVKVPLLFKGIPGIPEIYGVIFQNGKTEILQQFAGLSMRKLIDSDYAPKLRDPMMVLLLAFQAFATLDKLHSKGVTHQDIKPENLCVDVGEKSWRLRFIDFGTSQMPGDQVTEGLTYEYLSPESCRTVWQVALKMIPKESACLGRPNDVWALALSLLYCLCGYHVMVYIATGDTTYRDADMEAINVKRTKSLVTIGNLTDEDIVTRLIHGGWPCSLRTLLYHTLRVNPAHRWTAKQAASYILQQIQGGVVSSVEPTLKQPGPSSLGFAGLSPATLVVRAQPVAPVENFEKTTEDVEDAHSGQLPMFHDLLPDDLSRKAPRTYKRRVQRDNPYEQCPRHTGCKVIKN